MDDVASLADLRGFLLQQALDFMSERSADARNRFTRAVHELLERASDEELRRVVQRVRSAVDDWGYHPSEELARGIYHAIADVSLTQDSRLEGREHVEPLAGRHVMFLPNHISYSDANLFEILMHRSGLDPVCRRLTVLAGPKVYADPLRRFSSLCFGTIKTPQNTQRASGEAVMRPRDVARIARLTIALAFQRLDAGDALLVFAEGARSRDVALQPLLPAIARYCERPELWLVPVGIVGTEKLMGVGDSLIQSTRVIVRLGAAVQAAELHDRCRGNRTKIADTLGRAIAGTLPAAYRGVYA